MKRISLQILLLTFILAGLARCHTVFLTGPLVPKKAEVLSSQVSGAWLFRDTGADYVLFIHPNFKDVAMVRLNSNGTKAGTSRVLLTAWKDGFGIANILEKDVGGREKHAPYPLLFRLESGGKKATIYSVATKPFEKWVKTGKLRGKITKRGSMFRVTRVYIESAPAEVMELMETVPREELLGERLGELTKIDAIPVPAIKTTDSK